MAATWLETCHLGGADIEDPWSAPKGACASAGLMVCFQQRDGDTLTGKQRRGS